MTQQLTTGQHGRDDWVDWLRGASVLMVIVLHAYGFAFDAYPELRGGAAEESSALMLSIERLNRSLAPLRMQLMFLLSGLFVARGLDKGIAPYLGGKLRHVLYPYLLWSVLIFALREAGSVLAKAEPIAWLDLGKIAVGNVALTWFLFYLFVFLVLMPLLRRLPAQQRHQHQKHE
ncbi:acyltransferase family protein, partial [Xanthomonas arboricola]|uniref:acyltransferase family protein n=1 Tax=Xanthomonas arboricola TaxID=56448 RepID=UPI0021570605